MNRSDRYILRIFRRGGGVASPYHLIRLRDLEAQGYCEVSEYADDASRPHPDVLAYCVLTAKGAEAAR